MSSDDRAIRSQEALAEYAALRAESDRRSTTQQALVVLQLAAVSAIIAAAARTASAGGAVPLFGSPGRFYLIATIPLISFSLAHLWMDHDGWIDRIGRHIRLNIEKGRAMSWQEELEELDARNRKQKRRDWARYGYVAAYWCVFTVPSVFALIALARNASSALHWITVGLAAALTIISTFEWIVRVGLRRSASVPK